MKLLKVKEMAEALNVSKSVAYKLIDTGKIPSYRIETAIRIDEEDVKKYLASRKLEAFKK